MNIPIFLQTFDYQNYLAAFALTLIAGVSTGIGSLLALSAKRTDTRFLSFSLGFSAGVMLYVSFLDLLDTGKRLLIADLGNRLGAWIAIISFFAGMGMIALIDRMIPKATNPHEMASEDEIKDSDGCLFSNISSVKSKSLLRTGLVTALALTIHNFPEGIATFFAALRQPALAIGVTVAIALHNIPEGISIFVPIYYATGNRKRAFLTSFLSGLTEPLGALVGFLILSPFLSDTLYGIIFSSIAGIMVFISLDELLPAAREYGNAHISIYGLVAGMAIMAVSLLILL